MRRAAAVLLLAALWAPVPPASAAVALEPIQFSVTNPLTLATTYTVRGTLYRPAAAPLCNSSVVLLLHGLSYGQWGWDFPIDPATYSVARALAERGYPAVAIDELGYGSSDHPDGRTLTVESYADMTSQMVGQLRSRGFGRVALMGHSAGTEISELTAALYGGIDALIATAYTHFPSQRIVTEFTTGDVPRALQGETEYFGGTPENRAEYMFNLAYADPAVVAQDTALANPTPSGEILSIGPQPSRFVVPLISAPTLLVLAEEDVLFPIENADQEMMLFLSAADKTLAVVPLAGHSFMLHPNAPETNDRVADWLDAHPLTTPHC